jgi:hypothetical protein
MIVAYYFSMLVFWQNFPIVIGPYHDWDDCNRVRVYVDQQGYETDACGLMSYPQDSILLRIEGD